MRPEIPGLDGILSVHDVAATARRSPPCRSPTEPSRGPSASTPTSGTTSRPRWPCWSAVRSTRPTAPTTGAGHPARGRLLADEAGRRQVEDASGETNMRRTSPSGSGTTGWCAATRRSYGAPGRPCDGGLDLGGHAAAFGGIAWSQEAGGRVNREALLAGSSSIYHALRAGRARRADRRAAARLELAAGRSGTRCASTATCSSTSPPFSMDWYYPVLGGAVRRAEGAALIESREHFVAPGSASAASTPTRG